MSDTGTEDERDRRLDMLLSGSPSPTYGAKSRPATCGTVERRRNRQKPGCHDVQQHKPSQDRFLQKYVQHLEQSLKNRQHDFLEVAREKRQLESQMKRFERQPPEARFGDLFDGKEKLPSKIRAIAEDNRATKLEARKLRERCNELLQNNSLLASQNSSLAARLKGTKAERAQCTLSLQEIERLQECARHIPVLESQIRKLTDRNNILQHKIESDDVRRLRTKNSHAREQKKLLEQLTRAQADAHKSHAQVQRLTTLLRGEQRKAKRMGSARRKQANSDPTVPQAAVHVMLFVVHDPQPSQNARDACAMDAHPPASLCCTATKSPSGSSIVRSLSAPRVRTASMARASATSESQPSCAAPDVPRRRPATAVGAARFYSSSSPQGAADDCTSTSLATLHDDGDDEVLGRLSGVIGRADHDCNATEATADDEHLLCGSLSLDDEGTIVMP